MNRIRCLLVRSTLVAAPSGLYWNVEQGPSISTHARKTGSGDAESLGARVWNGRRTRRATGSSAAFRTPANTPPRTGGLERPTSLVRGQFGRRRVVSRWFRLLPASRQQVPCNTVVPWLLSGRQRASREIAETSVDPQSFGCYRRHPAEGPPVAGSTCARELVLDDANNHDRPKDGDCDKCEPSFSPVKAFLDVGGLAPARVHERNGHQRHRH